MTTSLSILLWSILMAFSIHIVEESAVGNGFIQMMKKNFWPEYDGRKFFWFNLILFSLFEIGIVLFEIFQHAWVIWPLGFAFMCATNGIWHLLQTANIREYSPSLIISPIMLTDEIRPSHFWTGKTIGT